MQHHHTEVHGSFSTQSQATALQAGCMHQLLGRMAVERPVPRAPASWCVHALVNVKAENVKKEHIETEAAQSRETR